MQSYLLSTRELAEGVTAPVLIKVGQLGGDWIPPQRVYLAIEVDEEMRKLREANRLLQARDDYVTGCLV